MKEGDNMKDQTIMLVIGIVALLAITISTISAFNDPLAGNEWVCVEAECTNSISGEEWAQEFCLQDGDRTVCPIQVEGQQVLLPLDELREQVNLDEFEQCVEARCVAESLVREVSYSLDLTDELSEEPLNQAETTEPVEEGTN